ncbi:MAG: hypothetical protein Q9202_007071, partial [Teloschistes flavicans]
GSQLETFPLKLRLTGKVYKNGILYSDGLVKREGTIDIHRNLYDFLCRLRKANYERFIWIDAICINQNDDRDKNMQIPLMRHIYQEARQVKIWLGEATPIEEEALASIPSLTEKLEECRNPPVLDCEIPETFESRALPVPEHPIWKALGDLMSRSWFGRLWTLQEAILWEKSSVICCGDEQISWETLWSFVLTMSDHRVDRWNLPPSVDTFIGVSNGYEAVTLVEDCKTLLVTAEWGLELDTLLNVIRRKSATNPADMVFGMLALMTHGEKSRITVDVSLPVERVYFEFASYYILNEMDECLLNHTSSQTRREGLPSWCPDFSSPETTVPLASRFGGGRELSTEEFSTNFRAGFYSSGKWAKPMVKERQYTLPHEDMPHCIRLYQQGIHDLSHPDFIQVDSETMQLNVSGVFIDKITHVIQPTDALVTRLNHWTASNLEKILAWDKECLSLAQKTLRTSNKIPSAYWRTITADSLRDSDCSGSSWDQYGSGALSFLSRFIDFTRNRSFFATANGRIGIGPEGTKAGDDVRVIIFCPTPYILREQGNVYDFIGEAYVDGMMYGQALDMVDQSILTKDKITIA